MIFVQIQIVSMLIITYESNDKDAEEDTEGVTHDVHEHNRNQSHRQVKLALTLFAPPPTQNLKRCKVKRIFQPT